MTLTQVKENMLGEWSSIAPEIRPSSIKSADGLIKPFYLTRNFKYLPDDTFELEILNSVDALGKVPLAKMWLRGHIIWQGNHEIAPGAQQVQFVADEGYEVTPLLPAFADLLNKVATEGYDT
ncbi:hypothetical protein [Chitinophaga arvensicola]|uniref:Uncharacterized protein n=1 Tax=Chitinophaga arvensicola TaxID=29529 RepID=A0A1I0RU23_9BACT|nr:hypothetical protein [Chitinophaga arvensicola]SEW44911.1 hypothetical protein SAMN04488122_3391 [Chitinophaga arvensicola]